MKLALALVLTLIVAALPLIGRGAPHDAQAQGQAQAHGQDRWTYEEPTDKLTGKTSYRATRTVALDVGGTAHMNAYCAEDESMGKFLAITMLFVDSKGQGIDINTAGFRNGLKGWTKRVRYSESQGQDGGEMVILPYSNQIEILIGKPGNGGVFEWLGPLVNGVDSFAAAPFAKIEIPLLVAGDSPVIDLEPQDPALRKALGQCLPESVSP